MPEVPGPGAVEEGVVTVVEPPPPALTGDAVTTVPVIVLVQGAELHPPEIGVRGPSVDHAVP